MTLEANSTAFDPVLRLLVPGEEEEIAQNDDIGGGDTNARLSTLVSEGGLYVLEVTAFLPPVAERRYSVRAREVVPQELEWDAFVSGELSDGDKGHGMWRIAGKSGQVIGVEVVAEFDTVIGLWSPTGEKIANDNATGRLLVTLEDNGRHVIQVEAENDLQADGDSPRTYRVRTQEVTPRPLGWNEFVSARLGGEGHREYGVWVIEGTSGEWIAVEATADTFGTSVRLLSGKGEEVAASNRDSGASGRAGVQTILPNDGPYLVEVMAGDGEEKVEGDYRVRARRCRTGC